MSKIALNAIALAAVVGFAGSANAQVIAHKDISAAMALTMAETAVATCKANGYNVSANVLGRNGEIIVAMRGDNTGPHTLENSMKKAYTARAQRRSSGDFGDSIKDNFTAGALHLTQHRDRARRPADQDRRRHRGRDRGVGRAGRRQGRGLRQGRHRQGRRPAEVIRALG